MRHLYTWASIFVIVFASTVGDVLISRAMKHIGDLGELRQRKGVLHVTRRVLTSGSFLLGLAFMTCGFFSLLFALSWADVSLVGPASASLTFIANAFAARIFLREHVDRPRWTAALLVAAGVALLAA
jgi:drug/metabolite transporter (DMT)-like permease